MSTRAADIESKVAEEVSRISEPALAARIRGLLVPVRCEPRGWDYGTEGQMFPCWIVAEYPSSNTAFGYCEYGFGPSFPWGLHSISGAHMTLVPRIVEGLRANDAGEVGAGRRNERTIRFKVHKAR